jgi:hypothetical protein
MVKPLTEADFPERAADEDEEEGSTEVEKGRVLFCEMIKLTEILTTILFEFYTLRAEEDFKQRAQEGGMWVLEKAKPIQLRLKDWFMNLPECLKMENVKMRKLNSTGTLVETQGSRLTPLTGISRLSSSCVLYRRNYAAQALNTFSST